jgi:stringent starvation protein B
MLSNKPYLLRAFYEWISDSHCTPVLVVDAMHPQSRVPHEYVDDGEVVFNISPSAIRDLKILNDIVEFKASFLGMVHLISAPIQAILGIYAEENGEGLFFDKEDHVEGDDDGRVAKEIVQLKGIEGGFLEINGLESQVVSHAAAKQTKPFLKLVE